MTKSALFNINSRNDSGYGILSSDWRIIQLTAVLVFLFSALARAQPPGKTLIVVAHPDDEYYFAATVYRMAVHLRGTVDELVTTNGEGGFHYSTLAEPFYGETLATEESGRRELPAIRREKTLKAGKVLGIRDHFFLEQKDQVFTTDGDSGLKHLWNSAYIQQTITDLNPASFYDPRSSPGCYRACGASDSVPAGLTPSGSAWLRHRSCRLCFNGRI
jgi:GlcNAc-PI de-N-acetylase